jgi:hypothetical protein
MILLLILLMPLTAFSSNKVIYGVDNRIEWYEASDQFKELGLSVAGMVYTDDIKDRGRVGQYQVAGMRMSGLGVCEDERFEDQILTADCTAFLVAPDMVATAGHCIKSQADCNKRSFVFDLKRKTRVSWGNRVPKTSVYKCKSIVEREMKSIYDYAIIKLDKPVTDRKPLKLNMDQYLRKGTPLVVMGHPVGLPLKIADGASIKKIYPSSFTSNLDTYGGNSGSPVMNARTGEVYGILYQGAPDFVMRGNCKVSKVRRQNSRAMERVTRLRIIKALQDI